MFSLFENREDICISYLEVGECVLLIFERRKRTHSYFKRGECVFIREGMAVAYELTCPASYYERSMSLLWLEGHGCQTPTQEPMSFRHQLVNINRHLSTLSHYLTNIPERPRLKYQTLDKEALLCPAEDKGLGDAQKFFVVELCFREASRLKSSRS